MSSTALYIESWHRSRGDAPDERLGSGTGFLMGIPGDFWLVTAWHVLSGRNSVTKEVRDKLARCPDFLRVRFARRGEGGEFEAADENFELYPEGDEFKERPLWRSPSEQRIDVAALRIGNVPESAEDPFLPNEWPTLRDLHPPDRRAGLRADADIDLPLRVADRLYVLGFPFGDTGSWPFAVWTAALVASEPMRGWDGLPGFLLDSRTRPGQSGSPVLMHLRPGDSVFVNGDVHLHEEWVTALVGVYSGRINKESDLGMVWTAETLFDLLPQLAPPEPRP
ncbi:S1 family peptidase [Streptomyces sp. Agncl-13]|uniref:S1 family peptidase n=1 Tax=Streptomyces sp. Agncl-13 TaxID=3400628 RepID=UPI003A89FF4B